MMSANEVLFVVDGDNLFKAVQAAYGKERRISYIKLLDLLKSGRSEDTVYHTHIFVTVREHLMTQIPFVSRLNMLGFTVHPFTSSIDETTGEVTRIDISKAIIELIATFRCPRGEYPKTLIVASSSGAYADLYTALAYQNVNIEVWWFGINFSNKIVDVDKKVHLGEEALYIQEEKSTS